jgi:hypothetical protein
MNDHSTNEHHISSKQKIRKLENYNYAKKLEKTNPPQKRA